MESPPRFRPLETRPESQTPWNPLIGVYLDEVALVVGLEGS